MIVRVFLLRNVVIGFSTKIWQMMPVATATETSSIENTVSDVTPDEVANFLQIVKKAAIENSCVRYNE